MACARTPSHKHTHTTTHNTQTIEDATFGRLAAQFIAVCIQLTHTHTHSPCHHHHPIPGMKNKNKSAKVAKYVQSLQKQVQNDAARRKQQDPEQLRKVCGEGGGVGVIARTCVACV